MSEALPGALLQALADVLAEPDAALAEAGFVDADVVHARVNTLRGSVDSAVDRLRSDGLAVRRVPWLAEGLELDAGDRGALVRHPLVDEGAVYVQGASSWLPVVALDPQPREEILDLAAAPGGKSLHIAALMQDRGRLACVEPVKGRFFRLKANLERGGVSIHALYKKDGRRVGGAVPERFDRVLLDAPCSSEAHIRRGRPETWEHWSPRKVREASRKQRGLIRSAWQALAPGGRLVYSTCSLSAEEDELIVGGLLAEFDDVRVVAPALPECVPWRAGVTALRGEVLDPRLASTRRILPSAGFGAFFLAVLEKAHPGPRRAGG